MHSITEPTTSKSRDAQRIEEIRNTDHQTVETCSLGDAWRQGDVEIRYIGPEKPEGVAQITVPKQLAPGNTKGSRHCLVDDSTVSAFQFTDAQPLEGPVLHCPAGLTVIHPEHGDITMKEPGYYAIIYQRAYAEEIRRQMD